MEWGNIAGWFTGGTRTRELEELRSQWAEADRLWRASLLAGADLDDLALAVTKRFIKDSPRLVAFPILHCADWAIERLLEAEDIGELEPDWRLIDSDMTAAVNVRKLLARRRRWAGEFDRLFGVFERRVVDTLQAMFEGLPEIGFRDWPTNRGDPLGVPLVELLDRPAEAIERLVLLPYDDEAMALDLFHRLRLQLVTNLLVASGFAPETDPHAVTDKLVMPTRQKSKTPAELAEMYLRHTPFLDLLDLPAPFEPPLESRFEHCHIIGGTGHGKTQLMQRMILDDLTAARTDGRSVVVIDSQGDMINKLIRLDLFAPDVPDSLADRLVLIDPSDIEHPAALNLFDPHLDRAETYAPVDRERVLNGVVELYETFFGEMLGAELTQKQGVVFRYLARLMITLPGATIRTLMAVMEDGVRFRPYMDALPGSAKHFFATEFFSPAFAATKKQILRRLWGVLSTPAFERMFVQPENKLDLYQAMNEGKIILVSTAKDLLKTDGSALLGRFFIAMIAQAALERSVIPREDRTPTFVYIDEAQEYFGDDVETILTQARKYRVGLTLAHQTLDQLSPRLRAALHANTSFKLAGGVSARDARALADELHTTADAIEGVRRRRDRSDFMAWLKNETPTAIRLTTPLGVLERQPTLSDDAFDQLMAMNRARYGGDRALTTPESPPVETAPLPVPPVALATEDTRPVWTAPSPARESVDPPIRTQAPSSNPDPGKGGPKHRYLQALIKELGEQNGFRATLEAPASSGQADVVLERAGLRLAFEVSVTTPTEQEQANVAKCLAAGFDHVAVVMAKSKGVQERFRRALLADLPPGDAARVACLAPEDLPDYIAALAAAPETTEGLVKGYRVKVSRTAVTAEDARVRRETIARVVARSLSRDGR